MFISFGVQESTGYCSKMPDVSNTSPLLLVDGEEENNAEALKYLSTSKVRFLYVPCWKTMVKVPEEIIDDAVELATRLEKRDRTFRWKIIQSYHKDICVQRCKLLVIYSPTKDQAFRRGGYFLHKLNLRKFERLMKGYYWVKEYPSNLHAVDLEGEIQGSDDIVYGVKRILLGRSCI